MAATLINDTATYIGSAGQVREAQGVVVLGGGGKQETLTLASNVAAAGARPAQMAYGGDYVFSATWTGSATVQLQALGPDGVTYQNLGPAKTTPDANGGTGVGIGSNATVRVVVTGTPTGLYATLSRLP